jgi:hypothetical protein
VTASWPCEVTAAAVAFATTEDAPAGTVADAGMLSVATEDVSLTATPPAGASPDNCTVHDVVPGVITLAGTQDTDVTVTTVDAGASVTEALRELLP